MPPAVHRASHSARVMMNGNGACGNNAMISTATAAPSVVPTTWAKLRCKVMPPRG
ncbi:hypothetical protein D3C85_1537740 [compost metagenome]